MHETGDEKDRTGQDRIVGQIIDHHATSYLGYVDRWYLLLIDARRGTYICIGWRKYSVGTGYILKQADWIRTGADCTALHCRDMKIVLSQDILPTATYYYSLWDSVAVLYDVVHVYIAGVQKYIYRNPTTYLDRIIHAGDPLASFK